MPTTSVPPDNGTKKLELEAKISELVKSESQCTVHFEYKRIGATQEKIELIVTTLNPSHDKSFVLMKTTETGILKALEKVLSYLEYHKRYQSSYTVIWSEKTNFKLITSYFFAYDMKEVFDRFMEGKERSDFIIYEMKLNPIC